MSLRSKIILILSGVVILYAVFDNGILRLLASKSFESWEREDAERRLAEAKVLIGEETVKIDLRCKLFSEMESVRDFALGTVAEAPERGLASVFEGEGSFDLLYVCDAEGQVIWGRLLDPVTREPVRVREFPGGAIAKSHPLFATPDELEPVSGMILTDKLPMVVSRHWITEGGERAGLTSVLAGRFFDADLRDSVRRRTTIDIEIQSLKGTDLPDQELLNEITAATETVARADGDVLHLYEALPDLRQRPSILLEGRLAREITARGDRATNYALLSTMATTLVILLVLLRLLQGIVIQPLSQLTGHAVAIGKNEDTSMRVGLERTDEIGQLSKEFDRMLEKLAASRDEVVRTARMAGMSEIATGVLHNVGNVLNSVNVSASVVATEAGQLAVEDLVRIVEVMNEHGDDLAAFVAEHPQGKHLLPFITEVASELQKQKDSLVTELGSLGTGIDHIADLVRSQQSYAGTKGVFELAKLDDQVDAAIKICKQAYGFAGRFEFVREYEDLPQLHVDKHKLMEILVNLIQNARQALEEVEGDDKRITLRVLAAGENRARIEVADNGPGISEENLARVFHHGFTTKKDGHGFGLHVSANAATEMGASLTARSEGVGRGATFVLDLPTDLVGSGRAAA